MKQPGKRGNIKRKPAETLREKVRRHLTDKNDVITDEDIRNVEVGNTEGEKEFRIEDQSPAIENSNNPKKPDQQSTSWDVLSEGYD